MLEDVAVAKVERVCKACDYLHKRRASNRVPVEAVLDRPAQLISRPRRNCWTRSILQNRFEHVQILPTLKMTKRNYDWLN